HQRRSGRRRRPGRRPGSRIRGQWPQRWGVGRRRPQQSRSRRRVRRRWQYRDSAAHGRCHRFLRRLHLLGGQRPGRNVAGGVSGVSLVTQQIPYLISGAVVGLVAFGVASTLWISADLRDEWAKLDDIYRAVTDRPAAAAADDGSGAVDLTQERATVGGRGR